MQILKATNNESLIISHNSSFIISELLSKSISYETERVNYFSRRLPFGAYKTDRSGV
jgi:hypothetical protein